MSSVDAPVAATPTFADADASGVAQLNRWQVIGLKLLERQTTAVGIALVVLVGFFSITHTSAFATPENAANLCLDATAIMLLAVGATFVMVAGGIDLSMGAVVVFTSVLSAKTMSGHANTWGTILIGLAVALGGGLGCGLINAFFIVRLQLPALIVTLAMLRRGAGRRRAAVRQHRHPRGP